MSCRSFPSWSDSVMVVRYTHKGTDPLSQKRSAFVVAPVQGKIAFPKSSGQDAVCIAHFVSP
ncbi:hypothetical protein NP01_15730 [Salmonella enterica]|nr:hypothetical protein [Salmonella enterica]ECJ8654270.1 hypothetical protein [Salmonella enterica subsp. enterica serovar Veneziana]EEJ8617780.1 hypothetical protein [Salmonella enterica subsp. enterica serovar Veneziana]